LAKAFALAQCPSLEGYYEDVNFVLSADIYALTDGRMEE
jgi:hypothetical protein